MLGVAIENDEPEGIEFAGESILFHRRVEPAEFVEQLAVPLHRTFGDAPRRARDALWRSWDSAQKLSDNIGLPRPACLDCATGRHTRRKPRAARDRGAAISSCNPKMSLSSRVSGSDDQTWKPSAALMSCAVIRTCPANLRTLPVTR